MRPSGSAPRRASEASLAKLAATWRLRAQTRAAAPASGRKTPLPNARPDPTRTGATAAQSVRGRAARTQGLVDVLLIRLVSSSMAMNSNRDLQLERGPLIPAAELRWDFGPASGTGWAARQPGTYQGGPEFLDLEVRRAQRRAEGADGKAARGEDAVRRGQAGGGRSPLPVAEPPSRQAATPRVARRRAGPGPASAPTVETRAGRQAQTAG